MDSKKPEAQPVPKRTRMATFYITDHDHQKLRRFAVNGGFKSSSHMLTAIIEPLLRGDLSILSFTRSAKRLQKFMESHGAEFSVDTSSLKELFLFPPAPPPIPDETISWSVSNGPTANPKNNTHDHAYRHPSAVFCH
jgi:hypothetical protein